MTNFEMVSVASGLSLTNAQLKTPTAPRTLPPCIDEAQFAEAYQRGFFQTLRLIRSKGASMDIAEEVAQAAWARGWQYRGQLHQAELVGAWVNTIARNIYRTVVRLGLRFMELEECAVPSTLLRKMEASSAMNECSKTESRMLSLFYIEGYSTVEIAEKEQLCPTTVRVRLMRIRRSLRAKLTPPVAQRTQANAA